jgi:uncharacterized Zn-binding protein involved in type VI secretion
VPNFAHGRAFLNKESDMKNIIRIGDKTTGGGTVQSGSTVMKFGGVGVAREGDPVDCPIPGHGRTVIAEGHPTFKDNGVPVAFDGHRCACGCALISSMPGAGAR